MEAIESRILFLGCFKIKVSKSNISSRSSIKNLSIDFEKIECGITELGYNKFQAQILDERKIEIGYFALVISKSNERIDDFFMIYQ